MSASLGSNSTSLIHSPVRGQIGNDSDGACCTSCAVPSSDSSCKSSTKTARVKGLAQRGIGTGSDGSHEGVSRASVVHAPRSKLGSGSDAAHEGVSKGSVIHAPRSKLGQQSFSPGCGAGGGCAGRCAKDGLGACSTRSTGQIIDADSMTRLPKGWHGRNGGDGTDQKHFSPILGANSKSAAITAYLMSDFSRWKRRVAEAQAEYAASGRTCELGAGYTDLLGQAVGDIDVAFSDIEDGFASALAALTFVGATPDDEDLLAFAWAFLRSQIDIVGWALSVIPAPYEASIELIEGILSGTYKYTLANLAPGGDYSSSICVTNHRTTIDQATFERTYGRRRDEAVKFGRTLELMLVIADLAGNLLHEASHSYCVSMSDNDPPNCYNSYLIENVFRWAVLTRFSELGSQQCVLNWLSHHSARDGVDFLYGYDGTVYLAEAC